MRALVVGLGGMGSLFSLLLSPEFEVEGIVRKGGGRRRIEIIGKLRGSLEILTSELPLREEYDLALLSVKSYDLDEALRRIRGISFKYLAYLQNGPYADRILRERVGEEKLIRIVTSIGVTKLGERAEVRGIGETILGAYSEEVELSFLAEVLGRRVPVRVSSEIWKEVWKKTAANASINPITAISRVKNGELIRGPLRALSEKVFEEAKEAARLSGAKFLEGYSEVVLPILESTKENYSSMLQDVMRGRRTEIDAINGEIMRVMRENGKEAPYNEALFLMVKGIEGSNEH